MTDSTKKPRMIATNAVDLTATARDAGGLFRPPSQKSKTWKVLDTRTLVTTLRIIQDGSNEEHVKNNIQTLIDQVYNGRFDA